MLKSSTRKLCAFVIMVAMLAQMLAPISASATGESYTVNFEANGGDGVVPVPITGIDAGDYVQFPAPTGLTYPKHLFSGWECGPVTYAVYNSDDASTQYLIDNILASAGLSGPDIYVGAVWDPTYWNDYAEPWTLGDGTEEDPYQISTPEQLAYLSECTASGPSFTDFAGKYFELAADLDMSDHYWVPIGSFAGNFDGKNHVVSNVENYDYSDHTGFFSTIMENAEISNLGVENVYFRGNGYSGGLAGACSGTIIKCHSTGILRTYSSLVGGLIGYAGNTANIRYSYSEVNINNSDKEASEDYGGFVGLNAGNISDCYARGNVSTDSASNVGGFVGQNSGAIAKCYSTGSTSGDSNVKGGCGFNNSGTVATGCYFDAETNGIYTSDMFYGYNTGSMKIKDIYIPYGWDFVDEAVNGEKEIWAIDAGMNDGYPYISGSVEPAAGIDPVEPNGEGTSADPYQIAGPENLLWMSEESRIAENLFNGKYFKQTADINMFEVTDFVPIGHPAGGFQGIYDGDYHTISNLAIDMISDLDAYGGLFSLLNGGTVKSVKFNNVTVSVVSPDANAGVVAGNIIGGLIQEIQVVGASTVTTTGSHSSNAGSIVGQAWPTLTDDLNTGALIQACYNEADVTANMSTSYVMHAGGLVGYLNASKVNDCVNMGEVHAIAPLGVNNSAMIGGIVGLVENAQVKKVVSVGEASAVNPTNSMGETIGYISGNYSVATGCYALDTVLDSIGYKNAFNSIVDTYSLNDAELKNPILYNDFSDYRWNLVNGQYPKLDWPANILGEAEALLNEAMADLDALDIAFADGDTYDSVTKDFSLPYFSAISDEVKIAWSEVGDSEYLSIHDITSATVIRPVYGQPNAQVQLKATLSCPPAESVEKIVTITIKALPSAPPTPAGTGTVTDPYIIDGVSDLQWISYMLQYGLTEDCFYQNHFKQTEDIDMSSIDNFTPIGTNDYPFEGIYDGDSHKISNLTISANDTFVGLFAAVKSEGEIRNVILDNADITAIECPFAGILVYNLNYGRVTNCHVLSNCTMNITSEVTFLGGIVGSMDRGVIEECSNAAEIIINDGTDAILAGGIAGTTSRSTIQNCYNEGKVTNLETGLETLIIGGIVGYDTGYMPVDVPAKPETVIKNIASSKTSDISAIPTNIWNCYNVGSISDEDLNAELTIVGGITGIAKSITKASSINNFYLDTVASTGIGENAANMGASSPKPSMISAPPLAETGMTAKTDTEMKTPSTFTDAGWDAEEIWYLESGKYPRLNGLRAALPNENTIAIEEAYALLPASFTAIYGTHTNLLTYLNGLTGMSATGVTLDIVSSENANVAASGAIAYTTSDATGLVVVRISKGDGAFITKSILVTVSAYGPPSDNDHESSGHNNPPAPPINVGVNGHNQNSMATGTQQTVNGVPVTTVTLNPNDFTGLFTNMQASGGNMLTIGASIPSNGFLTGQITGDLVKAMENKDAVLEIKTGNVTYTLPASQINIDNVSGLLGTNVQLRDIRVNISVGMPSANSVSIVQNTANRNGYNVVVKPVEFSITCTYGGRTVDVSGFNGYVERTVAIPDGIDPSRITTGIVLNHDGSFSHIPTVITQIGDRYYARINSLTNSIYSVIWNPVAFKDLEKHWSKDVVNDLGSRLVVTGDTNGNFNPDKMITRAEFTTIVVKALGLQPGTGATPFKDVKSTDKFAPYVDTAYKYGIVIGHDGMFDPNDLISRAEAMTIVDRMMKIANYQVNVSEAEAKTLTARYTDLARGSLWAEASILKCLKSGIMVGKGNGTLDLQGNITNAEAAAAVHRLLVGAKLIN